MACCLAAPNHYLNQYWLSISGIYETHLCEISKGWKLDVLSHNKELAKSRCGRDKCQTRDKSVQCPWWKFNWVPNCVTIRGYCCGRGLIRSRTPQVQLIWNGLVIGLNKINQLDLWKAKYVWTVCTMMMWHHEVNIRQAGHWAGNLSSSVSTEITFDLHSKFSIRRSCLVVILSTLYSDVEGNEATASRSTLNNNNWYPCHYLMIYWLTFIRANKIGPSNLSMANATTDWLRGTNGIPWQWFGCSTVGRPGSVWIQPYNQLRIFCVTRPAIFMLIGRKNTTCLP